MWFGSRSLLRGWSVNADDNGVVALVRLQRQLFNWLHFFSLHLLYLSSEHGFGGRSRVDTACLHFKE